MDTDKKQEQAPILQSHFSLDAITIQKTRIGFHRRRSVTPNASLICLHGLASNGTRWHEYLSNSELAGDFELLAMDLRGHGRSMTCKPYTRRKWCFDLGKLVQHEARPAVLVGHSMGAQIALNYAQQYAKQQSNQQQNDLLGLVLIDPVFASAFSGILAKVARARPLLWLLLKLIRIPCYLGLSKKNYPYRDLHALDQRTRQHLADNPGKEIADLYMKPTVDLEYIPLVNYLQDLYEVTRKLGGLESIDTPVLVLLSKGASTSNMERIRHQLTKLKNCEIKIIDADHWLLTERPQQAREAIDRWCHSLLNNK